MDRAVLRPLSVLVFVGLTILSSISAQTPPAGQANRPSNEWLAWRLGQEYAYASVFNLMKESAQSEKSLGFARKYANVLGLAEPPPPTNDYLTDALALAKEVDTKHGEKTRYHFQAGFRVTDARLGALLKSDIIKMKLNELATSLAKSGIPDSVWSAQLTAIKAGPTDDGLKKLALAIEKHLQQ